MRISRSALYQQTDCVLLAGYGRQTTALAQKTPLRFYVQSAAKRAGITKALGSYSCFRRTFGTHLEGGGKDVRTVQELMRHANSRLTLDVYAQALSRALYGQPI